MSDATATEDRRNVMDHYKHLNDILIKGDLDKRRHNFSTMIYNLGIDYNAASCVRNGNAFLTSRTYIYGKKRFDRRGCVGTYNYENLQHVTMLDNIENLPKDACWIGVDNIDGAEAIDDFVWPTDRHVLMCFGSEGTGLPKEIIDRCEHLVYIRQYGSVRSINVAAASAVVMNSYTSQVHRKK